MSLRNILLSASAIAALAMSTQQANAQTTRPDEVNIETSLNAAGYDADRSIEVSLPADGYRLNARFAGQKIGRFANNEVSVGAEFDGAGQEKINLEAYANQVDGNSGAANITDRELQLRAGMRRGADYGGLQLQSEMGAGIAANQTITSINDLQQEEFKISPMIYFETDLAQDIARDGQVQLVGGIQGHLAAIPGSVVLSSSMGGHGAARINATDDFSYEFGMRTKLVDPSLGTEYLVDLEPATNIYVKLKLDI